MSIVAHERMITRTCFFCGKPFMTTRTDAKYCSALCRQRALRWRKRLPDTLTRLLSAVDGLAAYLVYDDAKPQAIKALNRASAEIDEVYRKFNIRKVK